MAYWLWHEHGWYWIAGPWAVALTALAIVLLVAARTNKED